MSTNPLSNVLKTVWEEQSRWSQVATQLKRKIMLSRWTALILGILGAFLATLAAQIGKPADPAKAAISWSLVFSIASAVALTLATLAASGFSTKQVTDWTRARSVAEGLKQEAFLYLADVTPYYGVADPEAALGDKKAAILGKVSNELKVVAARITPNPKKIPTIDSADGYIKERVDHQIKTFYESNAGTLSNRLKWCKGIAAVLTVGAALASAVAGFTHTERIGAWVAVGTTIAGAILAYAAAARYEHNVISYYSTADQLKALRDRFLDARDKKKADQPVYDKFVRDCEEVISIENQGWMANWRTPDDAAPPATSGAANPP